MVRSRSRFTSAGRSKKHVKLIREAAARGARIVCLQELFYGPYFCTEQNPKWYAATESIPDGPTTRLMQDLARELSLVLIVPMYEVTIAGVYYNTAAVIDADGTYLGRYRKHHLPQVPPARKAAGLGEVLLQTGQQRLPGVRNALCQSRRLYLLRSALSRGRAHARPRRRGDRLESVGDRRGLIGISLEARTARARRRQRLLRRCDQSRRLRNALEHGRVYGQSYLVDPRGQFVATASRDHDEVVIGEMDRALITEVRNTWQFYRDRRPETYGAMVEI